MLIYFCNQFFFIIPHQSRNSANQSPASQLKSQPSLLKNPDIPNLTHKNNPRSPPNGVGRTGTGGSKGGWGSQNSGTDRNSNSDRNSEKTGWNRNENKSENNRNDNRNENRGENRSEHRSETRENTENRVGNENQANNGSWARNGRNSNTREQRQPRGPTGGNDWERGSQKVNSVNSGKIQNQAKPITGNINPAVHINSANKMLPNHQSTSQITTNPLSSNHQVPVNASITLNSQHNPQQANPQAPQVSLLSNPNPTAPSNWGSANAATAGAPKDNGTDAWGSKSEATSGWGGSNTGNPPPAAGNQWGQQQNKLPGWNNNNNNTGWNNNGVNPETENDGEWGGEKAPDGVSEPILNEASVQMVPNGQNGQNGLNSQNVGQNSGTPRKYGQTPTSYNPPTQLQKQHAPHPVQNHQNRYNNFQNNSSPIQNQQQQPILPNNSVQLAPSLSHMKKEIQSAVEEGQLPESALSSVIFNEQNIPLIYQLHLKSTELRGYQEAYNQKLIRNNGDSTDVQVEDLKRKCVILQENSIVPLQKELQKNIMLAQQNLNIQNNMNQVGGPNGPNGPTGPNGEGPGINQNGVTSSSPQPKVQKQPLMYNQPPPLKQHTQNSQNSISQNSHSQNSLSQNSLSQNSLSQNSGQFQQINQSSNLGGGAPIITPSPLSQVTVRSKFLVRLPQFGHF